MKKIVSIVTDLLLVLLIVVLLLNIVLMFNSRMNGDKITLKLFCYKLYVDVSDSMFPTIKKGDLIIVKNVDIESLKKNDIIVFFDKENDIFVTHRIVEISSNDNDVFVKTKGDNNNVDDLALVSSKNLEGKYIFKISSLGNILLFFSTKVGFIVLVIAIIILMLVMYLFSILIKQKKDITL